jgi:uncharacterized membrane protein YedE/YeeE
MIPVSSVYALGGGMLLGLSALLLLWIRGRIAGISGIMGGLFVAGQDKHWRWWFVLGLLTGGVIGIHVLGEAAPHLDGIPVPWLVIGGLLVGFGARLGNGCTSGHGICGIGRGSVRSIAATLTFMATGMLTVFVIRHLIAG